MSIVSMYLNLLPKLIRMFATKKGIGNNMKMAYIEGQRQQRNGQSKRSLKEKKLSIGQLENMRQIWPIG